MACSLTIDQVRDRTKTETRRTTWTWVGLKPGDRLTLIEKGMGLKKGQKQVVLAEVEVISNDRVHLRDIDEAGCAAEGFPHMTPDEFVAFWLKSHDLFIGSLMALKPSGAPPWPVSAEVYCRRIRWRYL